MTAVADTESLLASPDSWTIGAFVAEYLRGTATFVHESGWKSRHKGDVVGVYVGSELRGCCPLGRQLMTTLIAHARLLSEIERLMLTVAADNAVARALYCGLGFKPWGTERAALKLESEYVDEDHLVLVL